MRRKISLAVALLALVTCAGWRRAYAEAWQEYKETREIMGTFVTITAFAKDKDQARQAFEQAFGEIEKVNDLMSTYREDSELSKLNREAGNGAQKVSPELFAVIEEAMAIGKATDGAFDVTVGPLLELWKSAGKRGTLPREDELRKALALVGYQRVELDRENETVALPKGMRIDLGGIAKGYASDLATSALRKAGLNSFIVAVAGDLFVAGERMTPRREPWQVFIRDPFSTTEESTIKRLLLVDRATSTSGHYYRYVVIGGKHYSHIVDPHTGWPVQDVAASVTVVAPRSIEADALATGLSVLGKGRAEEIMGRMNAGKKDAPYAAFIVTGTRDNYTTTATSSFGQYEPKDSPRRVLILFGLAGIVIHTLALVRRRLGFWGAAVPYAVFAGLAAIGFLIR